ncbi:hypothetical protein COLO4_18763 [Corchorus olitorius]|uniref:Uncharacterized protein n=1 Tax=Corchorus olitorius TaxID=93759 RepID=A0A1R3J7Y0_9ROSI|nr:hypothetical protein COLO4_18763 [Corchorus olitorius]
MGRTEHNKAKKGMSDSDKFLIIFSPPKRSYQPLTKS